MSEVTKIPSFGFVRGAVVRETADGPNMLVVRGLGDRTVVVVCEADEGGNLRLRDRKTSDLHQVLEPGEMPAVPDRMPVEVFPPGDFIAEELAARGWTEADLAERMGGDIAINQFCVDFLINVRDRSLILDADTAEGLGRAFDVSPDYFLNLDKAWRLGGDPASRFSQKETGDGEG